MEEKYNIYKIQYRFADMYMVTSSLDPMKVMFRDLKDVEKLLSMVNKGIFNESFESYAMIAPGNIVIRNGKQQKGDITNIVLIK